MTTAEKALRLKQDLDEVFDAGYEKGKSEGGGDGFYDTFWDETQANGTRTNYQYAFHGKGWTDNNFKPKYPIVPTGSGGSYMFKESGLKKPDLSKVDFSKGGGIIQTFMNSSVEELGVLDFSSVAAGYNGINQTFLYCSSLRKIEKIILPNARIKIDGFGECKRLEEIRFNGTIYQHPNFQQSPLSVDSMKNIISCLNNYTGTSEEFSNKLIFSDECWAALEADSTAPTGTTWAEYVSSLGWDT